MSRSLDDANPFDNAAEEEQAEQPEESSAGQDSSQPASDNDVRGFAEPPVVSTE